MRLNLLALTVYAAAAVAMPVASAATCYLVLDANDNVVYQDVYPPVDLSDEGSDERKAMRARNEHMIAMETDRCPRLEFVAGGTGPRINLEEMGDVRGLGVRPAADGRNAQPAKRSGNAAAASKSKPSKAPDKPAAPAN